MFGHQDEEQAEHASAATAPPTAQDHSGSDYQQNDGVSDDDYLNSLSSEVLDHDHPDAGQSPPPYHRGVSDNDDHNDNSQGQPGDTPLADDQLLDIKQQALSELSPLVSHLNQTAEEKFKTTMMMIQATDNQSLIPDAYKAAREIQNEKTRAQALLDIVNEINYFTHKK